MLSKTVLLYCLIFAHVIVHSVYLLLKSPLNDFFRDISKRHYLIHFVLPVVMWPQGFPVGWVITASERLFRTVVDNRDPLMRKWEKEEAEGHLKVIFLASKQRQDLFIRPLFISYYLMKVLRIVQYGREHGDWRKTVRARQKHTILHKMMEDLRTEREPAWAEVELTTTAVTNLLLDLGDITITEAPWISVIKPLVWNTSF